MHRPQQPYGSSRLRTDGMQVTKNMVVGESVYGEKRISVEMGEGEKVEYRVWNPFRSKLAASVLAGVDNVHVKPGAKVHIERSHDPKGSPAPQSVAVAAAASCTQQNRLGTVHPRDRNVCDKDMRATFATSVPRLQKQLAALVLLQVLYLGAASGTSVSHVSDIVGPTGTVYAVEFSHRSGELSAAVPARIAYANAQCK